MNKSELCFLLDGNKCCEKKYSRGDWNSGGGLHNYMGRSEQDSVTR